MNVRPVLLPLSLLLLWSGCGDSPAAPEPEPITRFAQVSAGGSHTCALSTTGTAYCWGRGGTGALGVDTLASTPVPLRVASAYSFASISAGREHTCASTSAGEAYCWGQGAFGKLGTGNARDALRPVLVGNASGLLFASVAAGGDHTCALTRDGNIYCWGKGSVGELGAGILADQALPTLPLPQWADAPYALVVTGQHHACASGSTGVALCWGWNRFGQLGVGSTVNLGLPERHQGARFAALAAGREHTCGLDADGRAFCWGRGVFGQLGDGGDSMRTRATAVSTNLTFRSITAGSEHTCALTNDGVAYCWGEASRGRLGTGDAPAAARRTPAPVAGSLRFAQVSAGGQHTCGVTVDEQIYCWGFGGFGQLGNGGVTDHPAPVRVRAPPLP
jgi:alpha-tubulin suppressor-like RCC1 family protein